jgi:glycosyltransferase involved in cell wall biosynthesis
VSLAVEMRQQGHDAHVLAVVSRIDPAGVAMIHELERHRIPYVVGPTKTFGLKTLVWLRRQLSTGRWNIVHVHGEWPEYAYYTATRVRVLRPQYTLVRSVHNAALPPQRRLRWVFTHSSAEVTIYCGHYSAIQLQPFDVTSRSIVISNGVDFVWPIQTPHQQAAHQIGLDLDTDRTHFVNIASFRGPSLSHSEKAHDVLIRAWREAGMHEWAQLHLLGTGALLRAAQDLASGDSSILFHGVVPDVHRWLLASDTFVLPSRSEGLPIAGIEAGGTGLRCIFTNIPPLRELAVPAVEYVPVDNVKALATLLRDSGDRDKTDGAEVIAFRRRYGIERAARDYLHAYQAIQSQEGGCG